MKLRRGGAEIHYEVFGKGPAIVFAHRGFPPSSAVPGKAAPDFYADDLSALIRELDLESVALVAQSMGGWTCLDYALREPNKVRALVMASTSGVLDFSQLKNAEVDEWSRQSPGKLKDLQSRGIHPAGGERMAQEQPALAQLYRQISELASPAFREDVRVRIREMRSQPPKLLGQLPMPVLFVTGDEDWVFPPAAGPALAKLAPKGSALRVPAAGHSVYFERAAKFNEIIGRVL